MQSCIKDYILEVEQDTKRLKMKRLRFYLKSRLLKSRATDIRLSSSLFYTFPIE